MCQSSLCILAHIGYISCFDWHLSLPLYHNFLLWELTPDRSIWLGRGWLPYRAEMPISSDQVYILEQMHHCKEPDSPDFIRSKGNRVVYRFLDGQPKTRNRHLLRRSRLWTHLFLPSGHLTAAIKLTKTISSEPDCPEEHLMENKGCTQQHLDWAKK